MKFNLNQLLISASFILDFIEMDILKNITNHGKRVAYVSLKIGETYNLNEEEKSDLMIFSLLHDIGAVENLKNLSKKDLEKALEHCIIGEKSIREFPFNKNYENIILYHHENYDGSGFFNRVGDEIPVFSQIIALADYFELLYKAGKKDIITHKIVDQKDKMFSEELINKFLMLTETVGFWYDIKDQFVLSALQNLEFYKIVEYTNEEITRVASMFSTIIDSKSEFTRYHTSGLTKKIIRMCDYYDFDEDKTFLLTIASDLHDIGKLAISNKILDKNGALTKKEFDTVKGHVYYTRKVLEPIDGFEEITEWAANHHERNDGSGYPFGLTEKDLSFESQLMAILDVYQALKENRPYRKPMSHEKALDILNEMARTNKFNSKIVKDIDLVFANHIED